MKILSLTLFIVFCTLTQAHSYRGNIYSYPQHDCQKPTEPPKRYFNIKNQFDIDRYNSSMRSYKNEHKLYTDCIDKYIRNAEEDIQKIKHAIRRARNESERGF